ncbi:MAG TPA: FdtA/QdtA family cupin domain-containing protein [Chloroflexia bacterium]|jgi:dTDP-4-dehydrorhamnose 3,5-epimerase-like enzyme
MSLDDVRLIEFPKISDRRGNLTFIEEHSQVPFDIRRVFYIYDIPSGENRGAHAHKTLEQVVICLSGGLEVLLDDGHNTRTVRLSRPWVGLYIPPLIWASEGNFDSGTVYVVLASDYYNEADYYRDYEDFKKVIGPPQL